MREGRELKPSFLEISEEASRQWWRYRGFEAGTATTLLLSDVSGRLNAVTDRDKCPIRTKQMPRRLPRCLVHRQEARLPLYFNSGKFVFKNA